MEGVICYFLCFFVEAIILEQYAALLFVPKHSLKIRIIELCGLYVVLFGVSLLNINWLNMSLYLLANFIFFITQYSLKCRLAVFHSTILAAVMGMCELIVYSIIGRFTPHFFAQVEYFHNKLMFIIFSKILFFAVIYLLIHFFKGQLTYSKEYSQEHDNSIFVLIFIPFTAVFVMLTFVNISDTYTLTSSLSWLVSLSAVFLLFTNLLVFGINHYNQKKNIEYTEMQLLLQKEMDSTEYYKMLLVQDENQSILIHDIKKHLQSIALLNDRMEYDKIRAYIQQLMLSSDLKEISRVCDHELLNAIISRYKRQCNEHHIMFHVDIRSGTTEFISDNDLTSLFSNLLDNAMEAACSVPESYIEINTSKREKTSFVVITVINSCRKSPFLLSNNGLITNKPDKRGHGFGIKSIQKTIRKYEGDMQMYYCNDTLTFHTIITLKTEPSPVR